MNITRDNIESTTQIRKALGEAYSIIVDWDYKKREERKKTTKLKGFLINKYPSWCASCGRCFEQIGTVYAAHIQSLEDGGVTNKDNIVLLCKQCHDLFDLGYASRKEISDTAERWRNGRKSLLLRKMKARLNSTQTRHQSVRPPLDSIPTIKKTGVYDLTQAGKYGVAIRVLKNARKQGVSTETGELLKILEAQIHRRRAACGVLGRAKRILDQVDINLLPPERLPLFYYEYAYIHQLLGLTKIAYKLFGKSWQSAVELHDKYSELEYIIGRGQQLAAMVIASSNLHQLKNRLSANLKDFGNLINEAKSLSGSFSGRWVLNCMLWKSNYLLKCEAYQEAKREYLRAVSYRDTLDVTKGWTKSAGPTVSGIQGLLIIMDKDINNPEEGLRLLARSLVPVISGNRRRPERIRDFLYGFEIGLRKINRKRHDYYLKNIVNMIEKVRLSIVDGSSFLDPYHGEGKR